MPLYVKEWHWFLQNKEYIPDRDVDYTNKTTPSLYREEIKHHIISEIALVSKDRYNKEKNPDLDYKCIRYAETVNWPKLCTDPSDHDATSPMRLIPEFGRIESASVLVFIYQGEIPAEERPAVSWLNSMVSVARKCGFVYYTTDVSVYVVLDCPLLSVYDYSLNLEYVDYLGAYFMHLRSAKLATGDIDTALEVFANPHKRVPCTVVRTLVPVGAHANELQRNAINDMQYTLEGIHGPPGTGKSTTIRTYLDTLPENSLAYVMCVRNSALNAIAEKLDPKKYSAVAFPSRKLLKEATGRMYQRLRALTLDCRVRAHPMVRRETEKREEYVKASGKIMLAMGDALLKEASDTENSFDGQRQIREIRQWLVMIWKDGAGEVLPKKLITVLSLPRYEDLYIMCNKFCKTWGEVQHIRNTLNNGVEIARTTAREDIMRDIRVVLCTVDGMPRVMDEIPKCLDRDNYVVIDEAGSMCEYTSATLATLIPRQTLMVGDHKQLPPFSRIRADNLESVFYRLVSADPKRVPMLTIQYRMGRMIEAVVSKVFYGGLLDTGVDYTGTIDIHDVASGREQKVGKSFQNEAECDAMISHLRGVPSNHTVAVICAYGAQLGLFKKKLRSSIMLDTDRVVVLSFDSAQGEEFDTVFVSTVRANSGGDIGFVRDRRRANVALSRARHHMALFVSECTFMRSRGGPWRDVWTRIGEERMRHGD